MPDPRPPLPRWPLVPLVFVAGTAIPSGWLIASAPDGSRIGLPLRLLEHAPFSTFLVPGLVLLFVVGGSAALAAWAVWRRWPAANVYVLLAGLALCAWVVVQVSIIRETSWLQFLYLGLGLALAVAGRRRRRAPESAGGL